MELYKISDQYAALKDRGRVVLVREWEAGYQLLEENHRVKRGAVLVLSGAGRRDAERDAEDRGRGVLPEREGSVWRAGRGVYYYRRARECNPDIRISPQGIPRGLAAAYTPHTVSGRYSPPRYPELRGIQCTMPAPILYHTRPAQSNSSSGVMRRVFARRMALPKDIFRRSASPRSRRA